MNDEENPSLREDLDLSPSPFTRCASDHTTLDRLDRAKDLRATSGGILKLLSWKSPVANEGTEESNKGILMMGPWLFMGLEIPMRERCICQRAQQAQQGPKTVPSQGLSTVRRLGMPVVVGKQHIINFGGFRELPGTVSTYAIHYFRVTQCKNRNTCNSELSRCQADAQQRMYNSHKRMRHHKLPPWYHLDCQQNNRFLQPIATRALLSTKSMRAFTLGEVESPVNVNW